MYWYKVKSMLIILFLVINVFLIGAITIRTFNDIRAENQLEESVINVLDKNNIHLSTRIPKNRESMSIYPVTNSIIDEAQFAKNVLMGDFDTTENGVYTKGMKSISIANGLFEYTNKALKGKAVANDETLQKTSKILESMGFDLSYAKGQITGTKIVYNIYFDDKRLFVNNLTVLSDGENIKEMSGYWITYDKPIGKKYKVRPASEALIEFLREPNKPVNTPIEIINIELGYSILLGSIDLKYKSAEAIPTYEITLNTGETFYFDARSD